MMQPSLDEEGLARAARRLGELLGGGEVLIIVGDLGAGKTTFVRALAVGMGVFRPERVRSPTFNLAIVHPGRLTLVHADLFRLDDPVPGAAVEALGLGEEDLAGPGTVLAVEWGDRWRSPPAGHLEIRLAASGLRGGRRDLSAGGTDPRSRALVHRWWAGLVGEGR